MGSAVIVGINVGLPIGFVLGAYFDYAVIPISAIALATLFGVMFFFLPETPLYLVKQNKISVYQSIFFHTNCLLCKKLSSIQEAKKSIQYYRNVRDENCKTIQHEIDHLQRLIGETKSNESSLNWSEFLKNPGRKAMIITIMLALLCEFSGTIALTSYTATIFQESGSFMSPNESSIVVGVIKMIGALMAMFLVERTGRKVIR